MMQKDASVEYGVLRIDEELPGISDFGALDVEVAQMRAELESTTQHMAIERELSDEVHRARSLAILESPILSRMFGVDEPEILTSRHDISTADLLGICICKIRRGTGCG